MELDNFYVKNLLDRDLYPPEHPYRNTVSREQLAFGDGSIRVKGAATWAARLISSVDR